TACGQLLQPAWFLPYWCEPKGKPTRAGTDSSRVFFWYAVCCSLVSGGIIMRRCWRREDNQNGHFGPVQSNPNKQPSNTWWQAPEKVPSVFLPRISGLVCRFATWPVVGLVSS